ncbi:hypothetical protein [Ectobacillus ponti]|uniref:Uncharacterized protein n=1 Tax=Ectobacillus ponti TaxID=2961894 RepID=A0AA41X9X3_9BACI|nr:hypothetical protein [Ectobacillus ponti]MCP8969409.1 hypothetical protein [Ectobacillus ponti]
MKQKVQKMKQSLLNALAAPSVLSWHASNGAILLSQYPSEPALREIRLKIDHH